MHPGGYLAHRIMEAAKTAMERHLEGVWDALGPDGTQEPRGQADAGEPPRAGTPASWDLGPSEVTRALSP